MLRYADKEARLMGCRIASAILLANGREILLNSPPLQDEIKRNPAIMYQYIMGFSKSREKAHRKMDD